MHVQVMMMMMMMMMEDIQCVFSERSLLCHTAGDGVRTCGCKEDTR